MFRRNLLIAVAALLTVVVAATASRAGEAALTVFAAASLKGPLDAVGKLYEAKTGTRVTLSFAASSALAKQIEAAAPADVFLSADTRWMTYLVEKDAVKREDVVKLLGNNLVLVAGKDSTITLDIAKGFPLAAMLGTERLAMGEPKSVPAGRYGREALEYYGVWKDVEANVAGADNVRAALQLVTRGEAPLGIVYETDAIAETGVKIIATFPAESHSPIIYPAAKVAASVNPAAADFLLFLQGPQAQTIFRKAGFAILASS